MDMDKVIERVPLDSLTVEQFRERYMEPNKPVVLTQATAGWRSVLEWVTPSSAPDVLHLASLFGESMVTVVDAKGSRREMSVADYGKWWQSRSCSERHVKDISEVLYLKDWHLPILYPEYGAYDLPALFADDWLNEHWAANRRDSSSRSSGDLAERRSLEAGDHRFVYIGPRASCTPLHADVFFSYSWSANVCGTKRWCACARRRLSARPRMS